ncbi:MAG TPA: CoA ester lyase [Segeticoccus sp.]|uniref:HpcH/HpaI aldolase/citrate lyase family protein n=1 Tax=Segeticoccus sp. TaxID=2706531 RepID=UPI002D7FBD71|nr:CoA ester lyase [Segeticoccus sp.]HET8601496.1 CoA ester lyase [Segeticoccus sp.]
MTQHRAEEAPLWRSLLYVPVTSRRFLDKAHTRGADAIQLDLEDAVAESEKEAARRLLPAAVDQLVGHGVDVVVRVNRPWRHVVRDLEVAVRPGVRGLALPKLGSAEHVQMLDEVITELEAEAGLAAGTVRLIAMVETTSGFFRLREIAAASPRIAYLTLGTEDFATSAGIAPEPELVVGPKQATVFAARAAGVRPIGLVGSIANYRDQDAFRRVCRRSRQVGLVGASAVHPLQVPIINEEFSPSDEELDRARRMVAAYDAALAGGDGAVEFEGGMIDEPVVERSRQLLRLWSVGAPR